MCQYSAVDGHTTDWHLVHLGRFALGGAGLVMMEATAVAEDGRITHGDTGIWSDAHVDGLARITRFVKGHGAAAGIQLAHAGRKASAQRPWHGNGPIDASDLARGEKPWQTVAPSALPVSEGWHVPRELTQGGDRRDHGRLCRGGGARRARRLRRHRDPRRARLPAARVPVAVFEQANRRIRRRPRRPHAPPA